MITIFPFLEQSGLDMLDLEKKLLVLVNIILIILSHDLAWSINFNSFWTGGFDKEAQLSIYSIH